MISAKGEGIIDLGGPTTTAHISVIKTHRTLDYDPLQS